MDYSDWAPSKLVSLLEHQLETQINVLDSNNKTTPEKLQKELDRMGYQVGWLPLSESIELLQKLTTNLKMKTVWATIRKRAPDQSQYIKFYSACQHGLAGWVVDQKLTTKERQKHFINIRDHATELLELMHQTNEFHHYSTYNLIDRNSVNWFLGALGADNYFPKSAVTNADKLDGNSEYTDKQLDYAQFTLEEILPPFPMVLLDIASKAQKYSETVPVVKKPNSENAPIHFFIRTLSAHTNTQYKQPLHEVVAITTSVVFNMDIDSDYVRKII